MSRRSDRTASRRYQDELAAVLDRALLDAPETGFWDDNGRPAPLPDDIDEWSPTTYEPITLNPGEPPF